MNNLDKDIEMVNKLWYLLDDVYSTGLIEDEERNKYQNAIENVLSELKRLYKSDTSKEKSSMDYYNKYKETKSELETYKKIVDEKNKELNEENLRCSKLAVENNDLKEKLKTNKKIAEKLALRYADYLMDYEGRTGEKNHLIPTTAEKLLDWAKREVENETNKARFKNT